MGEIVIGVDESAGAATALRWGVAEADRHGWAVRALSAWGVVDHQHDLPDEWFDENDVEADARAALDAVVDRVLGPDAAARVSRGLVRDRPARALVEASEGAELLVVGARGGGGFRHLLLGSVSEHCLHHARCPVAVIHAGADAGPDEGPGRVVVGVDGSEDGRRALTWALDEARARGAVLEVLHAWQPPLAAAYPVGPLLSSTVDPLDDAARTTLDGELDDLDLGGLPAPVERTVVCEGAAGALIDASKAAGLVVVGARGVGGFRGLLLGSVGAQVAHHAACPVVVVRRP
ncbi:MAG TPA: universal stress protein [Acidimicrobiales bacterium]